METLPVKAWRPGPAGPPETPPDPETPFLLPEFPPPEAAEAGIARFWAEGQRAVQEAHRAGASGRVVVRLRSALADRLLVGLSVRLGLPREGLTLVAQGGYGRRELSPGSDLDLLVLADRPVPGLKALLYPLWDLKLELGHAVRRVADSLRLAEEDHVTLTTLLDGRPLWGDLAQWARLEAGLFGELLGRRGEAFIQEKRVELQARRQRYGDSVYLLEPNVKQCEGGLRDLQAALWVARVRHRVRGLRQLLASSILPPSSIGPALRARDFLWRVRNGLHLLAGRKEDHLTFDRQLQLAAAFGYRDRPEGLGVEAFMRDYYLAAAASKRIADELLERCAEPTPTRRIVERPIDLEFKLWGGRVTVVRKELFAEDPTALARIFLASARQGVPLYSYARDLVAVELWRIDDGVRSDRRVAQSLRELFALPGTDGAWLLPMHELGALVALLPELGRVTALVQHDVYHVYTVDVHLLFALRRLYALRRGELLEEQPEFTRLCLQVAGWLPLCLGVLFHDAGKGQGGAHSQRGAELVRRVAERLLLSPEEVDAAEFLVREHLLLSHVAQRRDLSDPELIESFARQVGSAERLDLLYLLTYVDVASVGPSSWTDWKARLFRELYGKARQALAPAGPPASPAPARLRRALLRLGVEAEAASAFLARMPERYLRRARPLAARRALRLLTRLADGRPLSALRVRKGEGSLLILCARDRPGLLALFAGALAAHRIDILAAEVYSTSAGEAVDLFHVQRPGGGPVEPSRWAAARADLRRVLSGEESPQALLARRVRPSALPRRALPAVETRIRIDHDSAQQATVLDVTAEDRLGLLFTLARTLHSEGLAIALAKVTTEANRAVDSFYVTKDGKKLDNPAACLRLERALQEALGQ